jgi:hypothetical protein
MRTDTNCCSEEPITNNLPPQDRNSLPIYPGGKAVSRNDSFVVHSVFKGSERRRAAGYLTAIVIYI